MRRPRRGTEIAPLPDFAFAFLDCEFGGLDPELHDITEIGGDRHRLPPRRARERRVEGAARPERVTAEAGAHLGLRRGALGARGACRCARRSASSRRSCRPGKTVVPAGQNVRMDVLFLERAYKSCEIPWPFDYHVIDLATLFYAWSLVAGETVLGALAAPGGERRPGSRSGPGTARWRTRASRSRPSATTSAGSRCAAARAALRRPQSRPRRRPARARAALSSRRRGSLRARHFASARAVEAREERQQPARAQAAGPEAERRAEVDQHRAPALVREHVAAVAEIEVHDAAAVHLRERGLERRQEARGHRLAARAEQRAARPVLDGEGEAVDRADARAARTGWPSSARQARSSRRASQRRERRRTRKPRGAKSFTTSAAPSCSHEQHVGVAPAPLFRTRSVALARVAGAARSRARDCRARGAPQSSRSSGSRP